MLPINNQLQDTTANNDIGTSPNSASSSPSTSSACSSSGCSEISGRDSSISTPSNDNNGSGQTANDLTNLKKIRQYLNLPLKKRVVYNFYQYSRELQHPYSRPVLAQQSEPLDLSNGHRCVECTRSFRAIDRLRAHRRRHDIKKSGRYTCDLCNKPFVQQSSLITHKRIHTGEKPYHCTICDNSYGDLSTFTKHLRTHTGEKPYKCEFCGQRFSQSGNCLRHKRSVHSSRLDEACW